MSDVIRILLIEDEPSIRALVKLHLESQFALIETRPLEFITIGTAEEAIDLFRAGDRVDIILLDDMLEGGLFGHQLLHILKNDPLTQNIPVIMFTARSDIKKNYFSRADALLGKPYPPTDLIDIVQGFVTNLKNN
jgi:CheY-like chemotaxis protein